MGKTVMISLLNQWLGMLVHTQGSYMGKHTQEDHGPSQLGQKVRTYFKSNQCCRRANIVTLK
jgi:hypothetical protein